MPTPKKKTRKSTAPRKPSYRDTIKKKTDAEAISAYKAQVDALKELRKKNREAEAKLKDKLRPAQRYWKSQVSGRWFDRLPKTDQEKLKSSHASATRLLAPKK